jgi:polyisoprenoid-binding protein YceI
MLTLRGMTQHQEPEPASQGATYERWEIDPARSTLMFSLRHLVVQRVQGSFGRWGGTVFVDRATPEMSSLEIWVDLASINTDEPERDVHVRSAEFLDVARFPRATFKSTAIELVPSAIAVDGRLDLHGIVHDLQLRIEIGPSPRGTDGRPRSRHRAHGTLDRQAFGLHWNQDLDVGGVVVGDDVEILAEMELVRTDLPTSE